MTVTNNNQNENASSWGDLAVLAALNQLAPRPIIQACAYAHKSLIPAHTNDAALEVALFAEQAVLEKVKEVKQGLDSVVEAFAENRANLQRSLCSSLEEKKIAARGMACDVYCSAAKVIDDKLNLALDIAKSAEGKACKAASSIIGDHEDETSNHCQPPPLGAESAKFVKKVAKNTRLFRLRTKAELEGRKLTNLAELMNYFENVHDDEKEGHEEPIEAGGAKASQKKWRALLELVGFIAGLPKAAYYDFKTNAVEAFEANTPGLAKKAKDTWAALPKILAGFGATNRPSDSKADASSQTNIMTKEELSEFLSDFPVSAFLSPRSQQQDSHPREEE